MDEKIYCIYVQPEDSKKYFYGLCFLSQEKAEEFANSETKAGMGEVYYVIPFKKIKGIK